MKDDVSNTAGIAVGLFGKIKNYAKDKLKKEEVIVSEITETKTDKDTNIN